MTQASGRAIRAQAIIISILVAVVVSGGTSVVVNTGPFPSAEAAARGEAKVDWLDADRADDRACTECFAALELQRYLRRMTGRADDFAVVDDSGKVEGNAVLVGGPATNAVAKARATELELDPKIIATLRPEDYVIKSPGVNAQRSSIAVAGGGRVGTLYAAYDLLHRLGCRWFAPGEVHEEIPRIDLGQFPVLNVVGKPSFVTRGFHAWQDRGDEDFLLWMARNRMNYWCVEQSNHPFVRKLGIQMSCGGHTAQGKFLNPHRAYPYDHAKLEGDEKKPKDPYPLSEQCKGDANKDGKLSYFEAHPEWYALVKGKRIPGFTSEFGTNYCSSNADATTEFMKNYIQSLVDGPYRDADVVRFWTLDGGKWCQCDACKALGIPTDRNLLLVHRLDQEIKKARAAGRIHRPIIIRFLAYHDVLQPPTRPLPKGFDYATCSATFFPIVRSYVRNFDDPASTRNSHYRKQLYGWALDPKRHYRGQLCIGEYYNVSGYKCLPIVFMHTMANDIPYYHKVSARHFHYMHVVTKNLGNKALTNYQMARQLWDVGTDCEALWADYFARRYGPAADTMRRFYESLEKMLSNVSEIKYGLSRRLNAGAKALFPNSILRHGFESDVQPTGPTFVDIVGASAQCRELIDKARGMTLPERIQARVAEDERLFAYGERTIAYYHACILAFGHARGGRKDEARKHYAEARKLAELLKADTESVEHSSAHANDRNAFTASRATGALARLAQLLGPDKPEALKRFDPKKGVVLTGRDFIGGGAQTYGYGLHVYPGRKKVSDQGNVVYASPTGAFGRMTAWFRVEAVPKGALALTLVGLARPETDAGQIPGEILLNGTRIHSGPMPFSVKALSSLDYAVPAAALQPGENKLTVRNLAKTGRVGNRPWFGIDRAELRPAPSPKP
ncbi:DUF4838 domain-containing protein [Planctomycetota bacterium]